MNKNLMRGRPCSGELANGSEAHIHQGVSGELLRDFPGNRAVKVGWVCPGAAYQGAPIVRGGWRSEEHTSELQSQSNLVCRLLLVKKKKSTTITPMAASVPLHSAERM